MKKLIYFTIGKNLLFVNLFKMCIETLNKTGYDGDILIITDCREKIEQNIKFINDVYFLELEKCNLIQSSANKFKIYKFEKVNEYDKIIYCDVDILWCKNPDYLFNLINEDLIYVANERRLLTSKFYNNNLNQDEINLITEKQIQGFSAGLFGFNKNCIHFFEDLDNIVVSDPDSATWLEQPIFATFLFRNNIYSNKFNTYVSHIGRTITQNNQPFNGVAIHFGGAVGDYFEKTMFMFQFKLKRL